MNTPDPDREYLRDVVAKAIADAVGHGMREKCYVHADAAIEAILKDIAYAKRKGGEG